MNEAKERASKSTKEFVDQIVASVPDDVGQLLAETSDYALLGYKFISGELYTPLDMSQSDYLAVSKNKFFIDGPFTYDLRVNDKIGIIDLNGQFIVKPGQFGLSFLPSEGLVPVVKRSGKTFQFNFCKNDGKLLLKKWIKGTGFIPYTNGTAVIAKENGSCILDKDGNTISPDYDLIIPQTGGNYIVKTAAGYGLVDGHTGREVVAPSYNSILPESSGMYCARQNASGLYGYLDTKGKYSIEPTYTAARTFSHGTATVSTADGWGVIKADNSCIVKFAWDDALPFTSDSPTMCWVKKDGLWHCLDIARGEKAFEPAFDNVANFDADGIAVVTSSDGLYGTIDTKGTTILPMRFSSPDVIGSANTTMAEKGITTMSEIEAHRLNLNLNPERNNFRLSHTIDNSMWEY